MDTVVRPCLDFLQGEGWEEQATHHGIRSFAKLDESTVGFKLEMFVGGASIDAFEKVVCDDPLCTNSNSLSFKYEINLERKQVISEGDESGCTLVHLFFHNHSNGISWDVPLQWVPEYFLSPAEQIESNLLSGEGKVVVQAGTNCNHPIDAVSGSRRVDVLRSVYVGVEEKTGVRVLLAFQATSVNAEFGAVGIESQVEKLRIIRSEMLHYSAQTFDTAFETPVDRDVSGRGAEVEEPSDVAQQHNSADQEATRGNNNFEIRTLRERLVLFFQEHNPGNLCRVDDILEAYGDDEEELEADLKLQYGEKAALPSALVGGSSELPLLGHNDDSFFSAGFTSPEPHAKEFEPNPKINPRIWQQTEASTLSPKPLLQMRDRVKLAVPSPSSKYVAEVSRGIYLKGTQRCNSDAVASNVAIRMIRQAQRDAVDSMVAFGPTNVDEVESYQQEQKRREQLGLTDPTAIRKLIRAKQLQMEELRRLNVPSQHYSKVQEATSLPPEPTAIEKLHVPTEVECSHCKSLFLMDFDGTIASLAQGLTDYQDLPQDGSLDTAHQFVQETVAEDSH